jgi:hypothetical protein
MLGAIEAIFEHCSGWLATPARGDPEVHEKPERLRRERPGVGEALPFPAPNDPARPVSVQTASDRLRRGECLAELQPLPDGAWHPFRRRWATERKHLSPVDVAAWRMERHHSC